MCVLKCAWVCLGGGSGGGGICGGKGGGSDSDGKLNVKIRQRYEEDLDGEELVEVGDGGWAKC